MVYENPFVLHLRVAMDGYLSGTLEGVHQIDRLLNDSLLPGLPRRQLRGTDAGYSTQYLIEILSKSDNPVSC